MLGTQFLVLEFYAIIRVPLFSVEVELLYQSRGKWIALTIRFINEEGPNEIGRKFLVSIKAELRRQMKSICHQGMRGFKYDICCQIREASHIGKELGIDLSNLPVIYSGKEEYSPNDTHLFNPFDELVTANREDFLQINFWFGQLRASGSNVITRLSPIVHLPPSVCQINDLASEIGYRWKDVARQLKPMPFDRKDIEGFEGKCSRDLQDQAQCMLDAWLQKYGSEATVGALCEALYRAGLRMVAEKIFTKSVVDQCVT